MGASHGFSCFSWWHVSIRGVRLLVEVEEELDREVEEGESLVEEEDLDDKECEWCLEESW